MLAREEENEAPAISLQQGSDGNKRAGDQLLQAAQSMTAVVAQSMTAVVV